MLDMAGGNQLHLRCDPCRTCRCIRTLRRVSTEVRSFIGACNLYQHHKHNFTYASAPLTDLIKKTNP